MCVFHIEHLVFEMLNLMSSCMVFGSKISKGVGSRVNLEKKFSGVMIESVTHACFLVSLTMDYEYGQTLRNTEETVRAGNDFTEFLYANSQLLSFPQKNLVCFFLSKDKKALEVVENS